MKADLENAVMFLLGARGSGRKTLNSLIDAQPRVRVKVPALEVSGAGCVHLVTSSAGIVSPCGREVEGDRPNSWLCWLHNRALFPTRAQQVERERRAAVRAVVEEEVDLELLREEAEVLAALDEDEGDD
jgi:hypothetical protein